MDKDAEWCPIHVHDTIPEMPAVREAGDDDDRYLVAEDMLALWLKSPEPRMPIEQFAEMYADIGEEYPTSPECPASKNPDSDPAMAAVK